jgi:ATP-dependent exoDNAse (exonuclease V) beta subunit
MSEIAVIDSAARREALDPTRSFIVQAPAGSGKTELLTQRFLRLLATVRAPEQIVAITFTRKAAAEMRQRILQALALAAGAPPTSAHKRTTWELAAAVREADVRYGWQLEQQPSRLRIQTIDAFSATLARRLPVLAGTGSAVEPTNDSYVLYEAACQHLIGRLGDGSAVSMQLERLIVHLGNRVDRLIDLLSQLLAKRDQWLHPIVRAQNTANLRATLEDTLRRVVDRQLTLMRDSLGDGRAQELFALARYAAGNLLANDGLSVERRSLLEACLATPAPLQAQSSCLSAWRSIANLIFKQDGELYSTVTKLHGFPTTNREQKDRVLRVLRTLSQEPELCEQLLELRSLPDPVYAEEQWRILQALLALLPEAVAELQLVFQARGEADYVEVSLRALRALGSADEPTDLALAFDHRLQHLLVDEFQDTSFSQLDLLELLTAGWQPGDGRTLFCVGDPMQSIYRFRQAEVGLFIDLQHHGLRNVSLTPLRLMANFRSEPAIVEWVNRVFPRVLASRSDAELGAVEYSPSAAVREGSGSVEIHAAVNGDDTTEAATVVGIVKDAQSRNRDQTIAILVSTRTRVDAIARALTQANIDFQAVEIERLRDRPIVQDLIALTRALVHLADRSAWLSVLRAPWCALTLADLHALTSHPAVSIADALQAATEGEVLGLSEEGSARIRRTYGVLAAALAERGRHSLRDSIERAWNALAGPATALRAQDLDDADAYFTRLEEIETSGDLEDVARLENQLEQLFARPKLVEKASVEIMTIHAAKGLEFDVVILPGLHAAPRNEDRELMRWTRFAGDAGGIVLAPLKAEGGDNDPIYRWIALLEQRRVSLERARLLYVAATRTKRELHLLGNAKVKLDGQPLTPDEPRKGSMLKMLWHAVVGEFEAAAPNAQARSRSGNERPAQQIRRLPLDWSMPSVAASITAPAQRMSESEAERPVFDWVSQTSRHVGTVVHRELDRALRTPKSQAPDLFDVERIATELGELGVPTARCTEAAQRVIAALERMRADARGRWLLGLETGVRDIQSELALTGVLHGQLVHGVIDRTFRDDAGTRWIVDFKTSTHEGGGLEAFLDEEVVRYTPQLRRYADLMRKLRPEEPIRIALYFPLIGAWREVAA